jgi:transcriptional regulator with XRE-family HTH domain
MRNNPYLKIIGKRVQKARMSKGISVRKLAEMCNADYSNFSRFESGRVNIRLSTLKCMADVLDIDIKELV